MSLRAKVWSLLDVILRVPPVFLMDAVLNAGFGIAKNNWNTDKPSESSEQQNINLEDEVLPPVIEIDNASLSWLLLYSQGFIAALVVFVLNTKQLLSIYLLFASFGVIIWSYVCNEEYIKYVSSLAERHTNIVYEMIAINKRALLKFGGNYLLQMFLAMIFCFSNNTSPCVSPLRAIGLSFIGPTVISLLPLPSAILTCTPLASAAISFFFIVANSLTHCQMIYETIHNSYQWSRGIIQHYGMYTFLENQWIRLHVPQVLRVFWLTRLAEQCVFLLADAAHTEYQTNGLISVTLDTIWFVVKELLVRGCETIIAVMGMTSIISSISHYIGYVMQTFLLLEDPEDRSIGTVSAILFFVLALQTGLTGMEPEKRFLRLYRNLCLLFTAVLHFIHNMVNPLLLSLSASRNTSVNKHSRALIVCTFLIVFPCWFLTLLWTKHTISTWLLAVSAFSIEVVIKVIISLLVYVLFMIDAYRNTFWEKLDDYVYYIRATGNTVEFIFGIFLFFNGAWILLFESGGTIRACMMCIHAYFNIWLQAKAGWKVFMKRRSAVHKINSLPEATEEQLTNFDDVCAICYQELHNARITRCNHYFHGVCLRKWLYVQDICPLCHKTLYNVETGDLNADSQDETRGNAAVVEHEHQD